MANETECPQSEEQPKRGPGRPANEWPEPIPDTPENVARALFRMRPKKAHEWKYIQEHRAKHGSRNDE